MQTVKATVTEIPMRNVGMMTLGQLNEIISALPATKVKVERSAIYISVRVAVSNQDVITAAKIKGHWHVRAREGLISRH